MTSQERIRDLRAELAALRARHDSGAMSAGTYDVVREIEIEIGWLEHRAGMEMNRREIP
jgi:hypothetical protein